MYNVYLEFKTINYEIIIVRQHDQIIISNPFKWHIALHQRL